MNWNQEQGRYSMPLEQHVRHCIEGQKCDFLLWLKKYALESV